MTVVPSPKSNPEPDPERSETTDQFPVHTADGVPVTVVPATPADPNTPTRLDMNLATAAHLGCFVAAWFALGILAPIITLLLRGDRPFVRHHSQQSINLNLTTYLLMALAAIGVGVAVLGGTGAALSWNGDNPLLPTGLTAGTVALVVGLLAGAALWMAYYFIATLRAGFAAMEGEYYRFRLCLPFLGRRR
jgi:uncharacterized Tic20 family protein